MFNLFTLRTDGLERGFPYNILLIRVTQHNEPKILEMQLSNLKNPQ